MVKKCKECGELKPIERFYRHPHMADGRLNKCKECIRSAQRVRRAIRYLTRLSTYDSWLCRQTEAYRKRIGSRRAMIAEHLGK